MGNKNKQKDISRRGFLKTAATISAALTIQPAINKVKATSAALNGKSTSRNLPKDAASHTR